MATKQEMEAEIAALKAKVDELQSLSPEAVKANLGPAVEAELTKLRDDVSALAQERDQLKTDLDGLQALMASKADEMNEMDGKLVQLSSENSDLKQKLSAAPVLGGNAVVWEGSSKEIIYHGGLRDLLEQYKRRNVEDGWLALVVKHPY